MSEVKRHYIADESLVGIEREYVEVLDNKGDKASALDEKYSVLIPLNSDAPQSPQSTDDIIANLVARLAKAERKITELSEQVDNNTDNIRTWAGETESVKAKLGILRETNFEWAVDVERKIEMLTDDIAMLDERTQPLTTEGVSKLSKELAQVATEAIDEKLRKGWR